MLLKFVARILSCNEICVVSCYKFHQLISFTLFFKLTVLLFLDFPKLQFAFDFGQNNYEFQKALWKVNKKHIYVMQVRKRNMLRATEFTTILN
jgi:hypothetical protein